MIFEEFTNNDLLSQKLTRSILGKGITHAYIFEGDYQTDKMAYGLAFVQAILCDNRPGYGCHQCLPCKKIEHGNHEDIFITQTTDKGNTKDQEIYRLQEHISRKPYGGDRNIAIISDADSMTKKAQNRLLKTLEEPPAGAVIILLSNNTENLESTILSRSLVYRVNAFEEPGTGENGEDIRKVVRMLLVGEPFYKLKKELANHGTSRENALRFLDGIQTTYRNLLLQHEEDSKLYKNGDISRIVRIIEEARRDIQSGVNPMYSLKNMVLKIGG